MPPPSPSRRGRAAGKRVRFGADVGRKCRPSQTNLRPMERIVKKAKASTIKDQLLRVLYAWDLIWREYLDMYYDETMMLKEGVRLPDLTTSQKRLDLEALAIECQRLHATFLEAHTTTAATTSAAMGGLAPSFSTISNQSGDMSVRMGDTSVRMGDTSVRMGESSVRMGDSSPNGFTWRIAVRENLQAQMLKSLIDAIGRWNRLELHRWTVKATNEAAVHTAFCEYVEHIEIWQKKYKSIGDGLRRLERKASLMSSNNIIHMKTPTVRSEIQRTTSEPTISPPMKMMSTAHAVKVPSDGLAANTQTQEQRHFPSSQVFPTKRADDYKFTHSPSAPNLANATRHSPLLALSTKAVAT